jgi:hypothetical protein
MGYFTTFAMIFTTYQNLMNTERDAALLALRPTTSGIEQAVSALAAESSTEAPSTLEYFLHSSLRAILKLQHRTLVRLVALHIAPHRSSFLQLSAKEQCDFLTTALKKDVSLRMLVIGVMVGHFTEEELERYSAKAADKAEIHKRIIELASRRACDAREDIVKMI